MACYGSESAYAYVPSLLRPKRIMRAHWTKPEFALLSFSLVSLFVVSKKKKTRLSFLFAFYPRSALPSAPHPCSKRLLPKPKPSPFQKRSSAAERSRAGDSVARPSSSTNHGFFTFSALGCVPCPAIFTPFFLFVCSD